MKILILGITGRTGSLVAAEAIRRGHEVIGIARESKSFIESKVKIAEGSPMDYNLVFSSMEGCDAVVSALNISRTSDNPWAKVRAPKDLMSKSISNAVSAMKEKSVRRIIVVSAAGVGSSKKEVPGFFHFLVKISNIRYAYQDHERQEKILTASGLDWTIIRPGMLNNKNTETEVIASINGIPKIKAGISRNGLAHFILNCIEKNEFIGQMPGISNK
jgi:putative NADH-flavin reductase